jgi:hypothetical protein
MDPQGFQQAIRTTTATYPIPFLVGIILLFALLCFGGSIVATDAVRWIMVATAAFAAVAGIGVLAYTVFAKPDLLRSESHVQMMTIVNIVGDEEMDTEQRQRVRLALLDVLGERRVKGPDLSPNRGKGSSDD